MANTFRKVYKKTGNSGSSSDYQLVGNVGVDGVELDIMKGASSSTDGQIGLVPKPSAGSSERYLSANGTFKSIDAVGDLSWLNTPTKKDLVAAVNDAYGVATTNKELIGNTDIGDIGNGTITGILDMLNNEKMTLYTSTSSSNFKGLYFLIQNRWHLFFVFTATSGEVAEQGQGFWQLAESYRPASDWTGTCIAFTKDGVQDVVGLNINSDGHIYHTSSTPRSTIIGLCVYDAKSA